MLNHVEIHHEDQMLKCPLISFENNALFVLLLVELEIIYVNK